MPSWPNRWPVAPAAWSRASATTPVSFVAGSDIAAAVVALAEQRTTGFGADLRGPEALTLREVNAHISEALGVSTRRSTALPPRSSLEGVASSGRSSAS